MKPRYALSLEARQDLQDIRQYYIDEGAPRAARVVIAELTAAFRFIARNPGVGHSRTDLTRAPLRFWAVYSYLIVYRPETSPIDIVAVIHAARNVEKLLARLEG